MKNLYKRLQISETASKDEVEKAIKRTNNAQLKKDATAVLLHSGRKKVYDRCHSELKRIAYMRANLGMKQGPNWQKHNFSDYESSSSRKISLYEQYKKKFEKYIPKTGSALFESLPESIKEKIKKRQNGEYEDQYVVKTRTGFGNTIWAIVSIAAWLLLVVNALENYGWTEGNTTLVLFSTSALLALLTYNLKWPVGKLLSPLDEQYIITPFYLIKTSFESVKWLPIHKIKNIKPVHNYRNGAYSYTNITIEFKSFTKAVTISSKAKAEGFVKVLGHFANNVSSILNQSSAKSLKERNDFYEVHTSNKEFSSSSAIQDRKKPFWISCIVCAVLFFGVSQVDYSTTPVGTDSPTPYESIQNTNRSVNTNYKSDKDEKETFDEPSQPLPPNGAVTKHIAKESLAPFKITTKGTDTHYYLKLEDYYTEDKVMTIFVRAGETVQVNVPLGKYNLKYTSGDTWYGKEYMFGPKAYRAEAEETFNFRIEDNQYRGYTLELYKQEFGNLHEHPISRKEW